MNKAEIDIYGTLPVTEKEELKQIADEIRFFGKKRAEITFKIGEGLARARDIFKYKDGGFQEWLSIEFNESRQRAYQYINFYKKFGGSSVNNCLHLEGISQSVLIELGAPSTSEDIIETVLDHKEVGGNPTGKFIKELKEKEAELKKLRAELTKSKEPNLDNLIPELKDMLDKKQITNAIALNYSQLSPNGQHIQALSESSRIMTMERIKELENELKDAEKGILEMVGKASDKIKAETQAELEKTKKELADAKLDVKKQLEDSIKAEVEKERKAREKAEREKKDALESMAAAHKETKRLEAENENLKKQTKVITPTNIDNKWAVELELKAKDLLDTITLMSNEMDRAGGFPDKSIEVLTTMLSNISDRLDMLEGDKIIEINKG